LVLKEALMTRTRNRLARTRTDLNLVLKEALRTRSRTRINITGAIAINLAPV